MRLSLFLLFLIIPALISFSVNAQKSSPQSPKPKVEQDWAANVTSITFDRSIIFLPPGESKAENDIVQVRATAEDKDHNVLTYKYKISGGRIIGKGPSVVWDLSGMRIGKYSITVGVDDGCGVRGQTLTKIVEIRTRPDVENIQFSKREVRYWCPFFVRESYCPKEEMFVDVKTTAKNVGDDLKYYYVVTGGEIVGTGPNVKWDLQDTLPGKYSITVGIGKDNIILSKTITRDISEKACPICDPPCNCGSLSIEGPTAAAKPGDTILLNALVSGGPDVAYKWTISAGTIISEPTASSITVKIPVDFKDDHLTATVELSGTDPSCSCPRTDTITVGIDK
jgi:hypothetical protein